MSRMRRHFDCVFCSLCVYPIDISTATLTSNTCERTVALFLAILLIHRNACLACLGLPIFAVCCKIDINFLKIKSRQIVKVVPSIIRHYNRFVQLLWQEIPYSKRNATDQNEYITPFPYFTFSSFLLHNALHWAMFESFVKIIEF